MLGDCCDGHLPGVMPQACEADPPIPNSGLIADVRAAAIEPTLGAGGRVDS